MAKNFEENSPETISIMGTIDTFLRWREKNKEARGYEIYHPSAFGKAQPLDSVIQTPYGPKKMGEVSVGDKICGTNGDVIFIEKIHPRGILPIYRVEFSDGDSVECSLDHLWEVDSKYMCFKKPKVMTLKQIMETYIPASGHRHYQIKVPKPLFIEQKWKSILTPYILGVIIGDGCLRCNGPMITGNDQEIIDRIKAELPDGVSVTSREDNMQHWLVGKSQNGKNIVKSELIRLGLWGVKTQDRFIPDVLLYSDIESRRSLLQGLMDSDGTVSKKGHPSFSTISLFLADQVSWLVKSLGGLTRFYEKISKLRGTPTGSISYTLHISHTDPCTLFHLGRKKKRAEAQEGRRVNRNIRDIQYVGEKECQCITVSNPDGLYLTDHCVVTHNCLRQMQYKRYVSMGLIEVETEEHDSKLLRLFETGHHTQGRWEKYFTEMGILRGLWCCSNPLCSKFDEEGIFDKDREIGYSKIYGKDNKIGCFKPDRCTCGSTRFYYMELSVGDPELNMYGHSDMVLDYSRFDSNRYKGVLQTFDAMCLPTVPIVADMKTINSKRFDKMIKYQKAPSFEYQIQLQIYINMLDCGYGMLIYECKDDSRTATYKIDKDIEQWETIKEQAKKMNKMVGYKDEKGNVKNLLPPPRPRDKASYECNYCDFNKICRACGVWDSPKLDLNRKDFYRSLLDEDE